MDVIYHQNCLDGIYSAYLMYLFAKCAPQQLLSSFAEKLQSSKQKQSLLNIEEKNHNQKVQLINYKQINQQFFHTKCPQIAFRSISMYAGQFYPIAPAQKNTNTILFVIDTSPTDKNTINKLCEAYKYVIIIQHHSSFSKTKKIIDEGKYKNLHYIWQEGICAAQLTLSVLHKNFGFLDNYPQNMRKQIYQVIDYVGRNDLKRGENSKSKQFVLGFYYFQIQMSNRNPWLFKRLYSLKLQTILEKGKNLYTNHIQKLKDAILFSEIWQCVKGPLKGKRFLGSKLTDRGIISDLGSILACLSTKIQYQNVAIIYNKNSNDIKMSTRSYQFCQKEPLALKLAEYYGGGGHVCAAGCCINKNCFRQHFIFKGGIKTLFKIEQKDIQDILFPQ